MITACGIEMSGVHSVNTWAFELEIAYKVPDLAQRQ